MAKISMKSLLEAGAHFGHQTRRWNPKMARYIFGRRNDIHIIDLQKTVREFRRASTYIQSVAAAGGKILFVGTKRQAQESLKEEAVRCGAFYVHLRWLGGMLTNFGTLKKNIARLNELHKMQDEKILDRLPKMEEMRLLRELNRLDKSLRGIREMSRLPDCLFVVDPAYESTAVEEANRLEIPVVAVCDTNCDPDRITHVIPANDDAIRSIKLFTALIADAILEGKAQAKSRQEPSPIVPSADSQTPEEEPSSQDLSLLPTP